MRGSERDFVSYLEKKYPDDSFEFVSFEGGKLFGGERLKEGRCKSENLNGESIYVIYDTKDKEFSDNYLDMKYSTKIDNTIDTIFKTAFQNENYCFAKARENFYSTTKSSTLQSDIDFVEYKSNRGVFIYAFVTNYADCTHYEIAKKLENAILSENIYCNTIEIYILDDYDPEIENDDSLQNDIIVNNKYNDCLRITMLDNSGFDSIEWEKN